jgi:hypothetical protein
LPWNTGADNGNASHTALEVRGASSSSIRATQLTPRLSSDTVIILLISSLQ